MFIKGTDSKGNEYTFVDFQGALSIGIWHAFWPEILIALFTVIFALITGISVTGILFCVGVLILLAILSIVLYHFGKLSLSHLLFYLPFYYFASIFTQLDDTALFTGNAYYGAQIKYNFFDIVSNKEYALNIENYSSIAQTILVILIIGTILYAICIAFAPRFHWALSSIAFIIASIMILIIGIQFFKLNGKYSTKAVTSLGIECIIHSIVGFILSIFFIVFRERA